MKSVFSKMKESQKELEETQAELEGSKNIITELNNKLTKSENEIKQANEKINTLKSASTDSNQVTERLLSENNLLKSTIEELSNETKNLNNECEKISSDYRSLKKEYESKERESHNEFEKLKTLKSRLTMELNELKGEHEEHLIMLNEEKMVKQNLLHELNDLKSLLGTKDNDIEEVKLKNEEQIDEIKSLNDQINKLNYQFDSDKHDLTQQIEDSVNKLSIADAKIIELTKDLEEKETRINKLNDLENELKQKQLTIGKLRHETIVLNEHLTKAMKLIKKGSETETVDRELISNLFISFLEIPRADAKKFEVLKLISNFLNWDDDKKRHAGLMSSSAKANPSLRSRSTSNSIMGSIPSNPLTSGDQNTLNTSDSFVSLWTEFLEKESTPKSAEMITEE
ncbi:unnamed protein product [[Candida] boidinii]|nr:unnamed protein product [[Candida] boidinii]